MPIFNETASASFVLNSAQTEAFHVVGGLDRLVSLWSGSAEALQGPQLCEAAWEGRTVTEEAQTFFNVGPDPGEPKAQTVKSKATLS